MNQFQLQPFGMNTMPQPMGGVMQSQGAPPMMLAPLTAQALKARKKAIQDVMKFVMVKDTHYGVIPGTKKDTLYKPGAECLCTTFHLAPMCESRVVADDMDAEWSFKHERYNHETKEKFTDEGTCIGYFEVEAICRIVASNGAVLAQASARCSNRESKYRSLPMFETRNTVQKMAEKRAFIAAALMATGASDIFTQDLEDLDLGGVAGAGGQGTTQKAAVSNLSPKQQEAARKFGVEAKVHPQVVEYAILHVAKGETKAFMDTMFSKDHAKITAAYEPYAAAARAKLQAERDAAAKGSGQQAPPPDGDPGPLAPTGTEGGAQ